MLLLDLAIMAENYEDKRVWIRGELMARGAPVDNLRRNSISCYYVGTRYLIVAAPS